MSRWTCSRSWIRPVSLPCRLRIASLLLWALGLAFAVGAPAQESGERLVIGIFALEHRPATRAVAEVENLLSARGTVELQPHDNTLVVRDVEAVMRRVRARLRAYDQPPRQVRLEIQLVRAGGAELSVPAGSQLPAALVRRLRELLRFESFMLLAEAGLEMREGEQVAYQFGGDYRVEFELGVLTGAGQLRLEDFIVGKGPADEVRPLIHTNLNLSLGRPMVLGLAQTEASERALMVVLTAKLLEPPASDRR